MNAPKARPTRRSLLRAALAAGAAPLVLPARLLRAGEAPSDQVALGVVGLGAQGQWDLRCFLKHKDVRVTALCDVNRRHLESGRHLVAETYGSPDVKSFADFRELHADKSVDAVLLALPVHWHSLPSLDAARNGKPMYQEKPMAMSFEEARRVREAVRAKGVVFQHGTQQRSDGRFRWACELARNGRLGTLKEIHVSVPGGKRGPVFPEQPLPDFVDWDRWVGPAPATPFHEDKLKRDNHENLSPFSLGMISCWGIHHLDIAQWGNGTDATGPVAVEGEGEFPKEGGFDAILRWKVRFAFANAAPVIFVNDGTPGFQHGVKFVGESGWVHVDRGRITAGDDTLLKDPQNACGAMPVRLPVSAEHTRNFVDAVKGKVPALCGIEVAVRSDTLCQLALASVKAGRRLAWDPAAERITGDDAAAALLRARPFRGAWQLPA
jgi:predicted dehydrogenase